MQILISPAAVAFRRVIGTDDVLVLVIDVFLLVPVSVFVVVGGRGIHHTGGGLPVFVTVGQAENSSNVLNDPTPCTYCNPNPSWLAGEVESLTRPPKPPPVSFTDDVPCSSEASSIK